MAANTDILIRFLVQSQGAKDGIGTVTKSMSSLSSAIEQVTQGRIRLTSAGRLYDTQAKQLITTENALFHIKRGVRQAADDLAASEQRLSTITEKLSSALSLEEQQLIGLRQAKMGAAQASGSLANEAGSASFAVLSLGQGFQDAGQFGMGMAQGIRAVTNNVQQAFQAFIFLREETGSLGGAFRSFVQAMKGPAGALLAFGAITAAIEFMSNRAQQAKKDVDGLKGAFDSFFDVEQNIQKLELTTDVLNDAVDAQERIVTALSEDVEGSVLKGQGAYRVIGKLSAEAEENMRQAGLSELTIQRLRRAGLEEAKKELEIQRALLDDLVERRRVSERDLAIASAARRNEALETYRLGQQTIEESDAASDIELGKKLELFNIDQELLRLASARTQEEREKAGAASQLGPILDQEIELFESIEDLNKEVLEAAERREARELGIARALEEQRQLYSSMQNVILPGGELDLGDPLDVESRLERISASAVAAGRIISSSMGQAGSSLMQLARSGEETDMRLFNTGKKIAIASAVVNTATGITRAYRDLPIWAAIPASATIAAAGAAQIAAIRAARPGSASLGGSAASGVGAAPAFFTGFTNVSQIPASSPGFPVTALGQRSQQQVNFVVDGRNLVAVLENNSAAQQRMTGRSMVVGTARPSSGGGFVDLTLER